MFFPLLSARKKGEGEHGLQCRQKLKEQNEQAVHAIIHERVKGEKEKGKRKEGGGRMKKDRVSLTSCYCWEREGNLG